MKKIITSILLREIATAMLVSQILQLAIENNISELDDEDFEQFMEGANDYVEELYYEILTEEEKTDLRGKLDKMLQVFFEEQVINTTVILDSNGGSEELVVGTIETLSNHTVIRVYKK